jgi:flagellar basal-body rod modification protein FlgD
MSAVSGIWNHAQAAAANANPLTSVKAMDDTTGGSGTSSTSSSDTTISANDFLTLLVTEMQNQDPTADTDPNEYINQLVNVNSLEQLININQTLTTVFPGTSTDSNSTSAPGSPAASAQARTSAAQSAMTPPTNGIHGVSSNPMRPTGHPVPVKTDGPVSFAQGNLSAPATKPSALRVGRSLDGQHITR